MKKVLTLALCAVAVVAAPAAQAKSSNAVKVTAAPQACTPIDVAYVSYGTLTSGSLVANSDGTYSGVLTVSVTHTNEHASADLGVATTYTLTSAALHLHGQDPAALIPGSRVKMIGKISFLPKPCDQTGFVPTTVIQRGFIKSPQL